MTHYGIATPEQRAAFLAQVSEESGHLLKASEGLNYSAVGLRKTFPDRFSTLAIANSYAHKPVAIANRAYAGKNGNGNEASGNGCRFRGRGILQITGRGTYKALGLENDPDAVSLPYYSAFSGAAYWKSHSLNERTLHVLNHRQFDAIVGGVNSARLGGDRRWEAYQRALAALQPRKPAR